MSVFLLLLSHRYSYARLAIVVGIEELFFFFLNVVSEKLLSGNWISFENGYIKGEPIYYAPVHYYITLLVGMAAWPCIWTGFRSFYRFC